MHDSLGALATASMFVFGASASASAQVDINSGNFLLPVCQRYLLNSADVTTQEAGLQGYCAGVLTGLWAASALFARDTICIPPTVTNGQMARVVVAWLEAHPQDLHEKFHRLALVAMAKAWPCPPASASSPNPPAQARPALGR
jgi:hypothetical protein